MKWAKRTGSARARARIKDSRVLIEHTFQQPCCQCFIHEAVRQAKRADSITPQLVNV